MKKWQTFIIGIVVIAVLLPFGFAQATHGSTAVWRFALMLPLAAVVALVLLLAARIINSAMDLPLAPATLCALLLIAAGAAIILLPKPVPFPYEVHGSSREPWVFATAKHIGSGDPARDIIPVLRFIFISLLPLIGISYVVMIMRKWMGSGLTAEERQQGAAGVRAWITPWRVLGAIFTAIGLWMWLEIPLLLALIVLLGALAVYPLIYTALGNESTAVAPATSALPAEREKVLTMVSENKISAEEGAELLNAPLVST